MRKGPGLIDQLRIAAHAVNMLDIGRYRSMPSGGFACRTFVRVLISTRAPKTKRYIE